MIIGFSDYKNNREKKIFDSNKPKKIDYISPYLTDAQDIIITARGHPICDVLEMNKGSPTDGWR